MVDEPILANDGPDSAAAQKALDIEYHRTAAAAYDSQVTSRFHFLHVHSLHPWVRRLVARCPGAEVLDLGTGTGVVACTLAEMGARVTAVDHSPDMLAIARSRAAAGHRSVDILFETGDCEALRFPDATFDAVTIQGVLHHLPNCVATLKEAVRVLRPGGELYISEPCSDGAILGRVINAAARPFIWAKRLVHWHPSNAGSEASEHEQPISGQQLEQDCRTLGLTVEAEYLLRLVGLRHLSDRWRTQITLIVSAPTRRRTGDLIFLIARKTASGEQSRAD